MAEELHFYDFNTGVTLLIDQMFATLAVHDATKANDEERLQAALTEFERIREEVQHIRRFYKGSPDVLREMKETARGRAQSLFEQVDELGVNDD